MKIEQTDVFVRLYRRLSPPVQKKVVSTVRRLASDPYHPSLRVRKLINSNDIFEARIDIHYRITFQKTEETLTLRKVGTHEIYRHP